MTLDYPMKAYTFYCEEINAPVHFCGFDQEVTFNIITNQLETLISEYLDKKGTDYLYRGTRLENLNLVLNYGIDNDKPNQGFWGNWSLSKCLEYGKLILCYDYKVCKNSWQQFELNTLSEDELEALKKSYLSFEISEDKSQIFFSMFPEEKRGRVHYEKSHGNYIPEPENQKDCLKAIILLGSGDKWFNNLITTFYMAGGTLQNNGKDLIDKDELRNT
jgi:hypothetical protein